MATTRDGDLVVNSAPLIQKESRSRVKGGVRVRGQGSGGGAAHKSGSAANLKAYRLSDTPSKFIIGLNTNRTQESARPDYRPPTTDHDFPNKKSAKRHKHLLTRFYYFFLLLIHWKRETAAMPPTPMMSVKIPGKRRSGDAAMRMIRSSTLALRMIQPSKPATRA